jgi:hypothetical protein
MDGNWNNCFPLDEVPVLLKRFERWNEVIQSLYYGERWSGKACTPLMWDHVKRHFIGLFWCWVDLPPMACFLLPHLLYYLVALLKLLVNNTSSHLHLKNIPKTIPPCYHPYSRKSEGLRNYQILRKPSCPLVFPGQQSVINSTSRLNHGRLDWASFTSSSGTLPVFYRIGMDYGTFRRYRRIILRRPRVRGSTPAIALSLGLSWAAVGYKMDFELKPDWGEFIFTPVRASTWYSARIHQ